ncbi:GNAT family N-acetyltransferase [Saccharibacillus sacchari]|uniref:GNAT family N-acetyltransferase n=1 Tax=Saccharibacillus sacchari TaxID=456493 RepID=A0ACC6PAH2_9BACL
MEATLYMRHAVPEDEDFRFDVYASTRAEEVEAWGWNELQQSAFLHMQFELQQKSYGLRFPDALYRIVTLQDRPVGHLLFAEEEGGFCLADLAILPDFRNWGIGSRTIATLQAEAGDRPIRLQVAALNPAARLYERSGFRTVGEGNGLYTHMIWQK